MIRFVALTASFLLVQRVLAFSWGLRTIPPSVPASSSRSITGDELRRRGATTLLMSEWTTGASDSDLAHLKRKELLDAIDVYNTNKKSSWLKESTEEGQKKPKGFFGAETRGAQTIDINDEGRRIISLIEDLAKYNPTEIPLKGFLGYKEV